jgi:hypothetical protein
MFPGESDTLNWGVGCVPPNGPVNWTETTAANAPSDIRGLASSGPFTFQAGAVQELDLAFTFARDYNGKNPSGSLDKLRNLADIIEKSFTSNTLPGGNSFNGMDQRKVTSSLQIEVFPNPVQSLAYLRFGGNVNEPVTIRLYNDNGFLIRTEKRTPMDRTITMDLSGLSSGLYLISVELQGQSVTKKVSVIQ